MNKNGFTTFEIVIGIIVALLVGWVIIAMIFGGGPSLEKLRTEWLNPLLDKVMIRIGYEEVPPGQLAVSKNVDDFYTILFNSLTAATKMNDKNCYTSFSKQPESPHRIDIVYDKNSKKTYFTLLNDKKMVVKQEILDIVPCTIKPLNFKNNKQPTTEQYEVWDDMTITENSLSLVRREPLLKLSFSLKNDIDKLLAYKFDNNHVCLFATVPGGEWDEIYDEKYAFDDTLSVLRHHYEKSTGNTDNPYYHKSCQSAGVQTITVAPTVTPNAESPKVLSTGEKNLKFGIPIKSDTCPFGGLVDLPILGKRCLNPKAAGAFIRALSNIERNNDGWLINPADSTGDYSYRNVMTIRNGRQEETNVLSAHAWGIALDINAYMGPNAKFDFTSKKIIDYNNQGLNQGEGRMDDYIGLKYLAEKYFEPEGIAWGGRWLNAPIDPMHFEATRAEMILT